MRYRTALRVLSSAATLALAACGEPTRGCDVCTWSAIIYGNVSSAGSPAAGVTVRVNVGGAPCSAGVPTFEGARTVTNAEGFYRFQVRSPVPSPQCVRVEAAPPGTDPVVEEAQSVVFKLSSDASLPYDSVRVDLDGA
jgi:hypothetical protein